MNVNSHESRVGREFSRAAERLVSQLDEVLWAVYQIGDDVQRRAVDATLDVLTLEALTPARIESAVRAAAFQSADSMRVFGSVRGLQLGYRELVNKLSVFDLVRHSRRFVGNDAATEDNVPRLVDVAFSLPPYLRIWAIEGLGHDYADWARLQGTTPRLLTAPGALPDGALPMMHAGLGLSVAADVLGDATPFDSDHAFHTTLGRFRDVCADSARPGYAGAAYESLGLVTRTLHPPMMRRMDAALAVDQPELRPYFWHGAGRALYFSPLQFVPGLLSPWAGIESEAPDAAARLNATAGLAWATVLVNMRQPDVVAALLPSLRGIVTGDDAFASGTVSALAMAADTDPSNPFLARFCTHAPDDQASPELWRATVPSLEDVDRLLRAVKDGPGVERLFRYAPVDCPSRSDA